MLRAKHEGLDGSREEETTGAGSVSGFHEGQSAGTGFLYPKTGNGRDFTFEI